LPEDVQIPETETEPEISELEPEAETLPEDAPILETETEPEISELEHEPETLQEDAPIPETETEPEVSELEPEAETSQADAPIPETETEPEITELDSEPETMPEESPAIETEPEPEYEAVPKTEEQPELDDSDDIHLEDEPEDFADREFNDAPEENLDTEEDTDTMPEDLYSPEEAQEDFTTDETEQEEEYNPSFLAAAMSTNSIDDAIAQHNSELADELLMKAAGLPSDRFEMLVIDLLSKMGYFAFQTARYTTESSGSDLIHGVILDNKTGANIYVQARKLSPGRTIGKADIQDFIDELSDKGGKGIYATTASFSENAKILATDERIMLIDGEKLANLMIANNFCVNVEKVYEIKAIDSESFSEYED
ncbi:MAG: restriction endonuclease, partial [Synergistaceae bacterium]|nr:restriction endonuclease [Synergistaceae bacterium]